MAVNVVNVAPTGGGGTPEDVESPLAALSGEPTVHEVTATTVADGLVATAAENGGTLLIGATRDRRLRRWVLGSTPDRVIDLAREAGVPVLVLASTQGVSGRFEDYLYPVFRYVRKLRRERRSRHLRPDDGAVADRGGDQGGRVVQEEGKPPGGWVALTRRACRRRRT